MPVDSSIYSQLQTPDIVGGVQQGLKMRDMYDQKKKQESLDVAMKAGSSDPRLTMKALMAGGHNKEAMEMQNQIRQQEAFDFDKNIKNLEMTGRILGSATDQQSWENALSEAQKFGIDVSNEPRAFDLGYRNHLLNKSVSYLDRLKLEAAKRQESRDERKTIATEKAAGIQAQKEATELNANQAKQLGNFEMGALAENQFKKAVADKNEYDPTASGQWIDNSEWAPNSWKNKKAVEAQAAQSSWVETFLRDASGAAIPPSERMAYATDYFPQPGDTEQVVQNKELLRKQKMQNALVGSGANGIRMAQQSKPSPLVSNKPKSVVQNGHTYTLNPITGEYE